MAANVPNLPLSASLDMSLDTGSGLPISLALPTFYVGHNTALGPNSLDEYSSDSYDSDAYDSSDDDKEMSDGGVRVDMSHLHADELNAEMDMVDAEVMGSDNLAAIATSSALHLSLAQQPASLDGVMEDAEEDMLDSDYDSPEDWGDFEYPPQEAQASDPMSEVAQQLQQIQDGQEQGDPLTTSTTLHGTNITNSIESLSSILQIPSLSGDVQSNLPQSLGMFSPTGHQPVAVSATAGSSLGVSITGQAASFPQFLSDVDWGGDDDLDEDDNNVGISQANIHQVEEHNNLNLREFLYTWGVYVNQSRAITKKRKRGPNLAYLDRLGVDKPTEIRHSDLRGDHCDVQGIDWRKLEVSRADARRMRMRAYTNYTNLIAPRWHPSTIQRAFINNPENYFRFRRMDFKPEITLYHFQLRNLLACTSRNNLCFAGNNSKVYSLNPLLNQKAIRMDLKDPVVQNPNSTIFTGIQISTIAADHNILIAGGFSGEYALTRLDSPLRTEHIEGLLTTDPNPITNHVQIHLNRNSGVPLAAFASNDTTLRTLDCTTNTILAQHKYDYPVNCSAISPDHRLRVIVGDNQNVMICDAEKGDVLQDLAGHVDYGFACAWADNGWHVATGNQDMLVKIWDARMWTDQNGIGKPLETIASTMAGPRSLKFSPLGSGKRVLVAAEAADMISIINAETYASKQTLDVFGEIAGVDFTPNGQTLFVGVHDSARGGIMEFERCGLGEVSGPDVLESDEQDAGLDWKRTERDVVEDPRSMGTATHRRRKGVHTWDMQPF